MSRLEQEIRRTVDRDSRRRREAAIRLELDLFLSHLQNYRETCMPIPVRAVPAPTVGEMGIVGINQGKDASPRAEG